MSWTHFTSIRIQGWYTDKCANTLFNSLRSSDAYIYVGNLTIIGSDNGLSPGRRQAIIWTNAGISSIGPLGTNFSEILIKIITFSFKKMSLKVSSGKRRPSCLGLNVLNSCSCKSMSLYIEWHYGIHRLLRWVILERNSTTLAGKRWGSKLHLFTEHILLVFNLWSFHIHVLYQL